MWWPFIQGRHLRQGVDLAALFKTEGHDRTMCLVEDILVEEKLRNAESQEVLFKLRATVLKEYAKLDSATLDDFDIYDEENYTEQTEDGYVGFAPLG
jgi:hypothetical protein